MPLRVIVNKSEQESFATAFIGNIKSSQQYLLFYYSPNKMFLKIAHKPMPLGHWLTFSIAKTQRKSNQILNRFSILCHVSHLIFNFVPSELLDAESKPLLAISNRPDPCQQQPNTTKITNRTPVQPRMKGSALGESAY